MPPHAYFVGSAVFHYLGPAFAVLLFARVDVLGVAWLRIAAAAAVFALWRRPWRAYARMSTPARRTVVAWGAVLAVMNACFYLAIDRLPLGTVAAIEFLPRDRAGGARRADAAERRSRWSLAVARRLPAHGRAARGEPLGVALALANAVLFALYIVLGHRVARSSEASGIDALGASMLVALVVATPLAGWAACPRSPTRPRSRPGSASGSPRR